jgi:hypothetical protein
VLSIDAVGWDASRPVPWRRLSREWLIYAGIMAVVFVLFFRDNLVPILGGLVISLPLYLGLGYVLAKLGYQRKTLAELRTPRASTPSGEAATATDTAAERARPAPTRRTSSGPNRPSKGKRR